MCRPQHIELPRSLVEVVVHWNIPMHVFLKNCKLRAGTQEFHSNISFNSFHFYLNNRVFLYWDAGGLIIYFSVLLFHRRSTQFLSKLNPV